MSSYGILYKSIYIPITVIIFNDAVPVNSSYCWCLSDTYANPRVNRIYISANFLCDIKKKGESILVLFLSKLIL
nr:MAG TPA: hypothetical protein [Caudoviricetes sp.]